MRAAVQQQRKEDLLIEKKIKDLRDQRLDPAPAPSTKRVMVTENRRSPVVETEAATDDKPNPFGKKKGWLSKLTGRS